MPQPYWRTHLRYGNRYRLREAAEHGQLLVVKCTCCHRTVHYLAADLADLLGDEVDARFPPFECGRCNTKEFMFVKLRNPEPGDYGSLVVRRPGSIKRTQLWRNVRLGDDR